MNKIILDINAKLKEKKKISSSLFVAYLKVLLDLNTWIVIIYRISSIFIKLKLYPLAKIFWLINRILFTVDIDPRAELAGGLVIIHGMCIVVGHEVKSIGPLTIYQGVTIGGNYGKTANINGRITGQPFFEENVVLGTDSCVFGPVLIKKNSLIGAKAIVTKDIPENSLVLGTNQIIKGSK
jgi:serine O-acetyltransferase